MLVKKLFPQSRIDIEKVYVRYNVNKLDNQIINDFLETKARVVPFDASTALSKLAKKDLKTFSEAFIDSNVCTEVLNLCRERGPRIKCGISIDNDVEIYSECFDPELFSDIVLGDISMFLHIISGYRDFVKFKSVVIPKELMAEDVIASVENVALKNEVQIETPIARGDTAYKLLEKLVNGAITYSEMIMLIPCLSINSIKFITRIAENALKNGRRVYVATLSPSQENASFCKTQYKDFLILYLHLIDEAKKHGFVVCDSDVVNIGFILDRAHYLVSNDFILSRETFITPLSDFKYSNRYATYILKHCLCSNHLIKEDRKIIR